MSTAVRDIEAEGLADTDLRADERGDDIHLPVCSMQRMVRISASTASVCPLPSKIEQLSPGR